MNSVPQMGEAKGKAWRDNLRRLSIARLSEMGHQQATKQKFLTKSGGNSCRKGRN